MTVDSLAATLAGGRALTIGAPVAVATAKALGQRFS
jgi:hypothetical protein